MSNSVLLFGMMCLLLVVDSLIVHTVWNQVLQSSDVFVPACVIAWVLLKTLALIHTANVNNMGSHTVSTEHVMSMYWNRLVSSYQLNAHFLYSVTMYMLRCNPQHVSSSTLLILRRTNFIITASGIITLCKRPYCTPVESGLQSALNRHTVWPFTESDDTRGCNNKICPPKDEQGAARNMLRIIM